MNHREDYVFWRLAYSLISNEGYRIVQLFENQKELWLEKLENKSAPIVRLLRHDLDWSNSMQRDIEFSASNGEKVRRQVGRSQLNLLNVYISQFPPVDDYEYRLAKPFVNPEGNKTVVNTVLLTSEEYDTGFQHLREQLGSEVSFPINEDYSIQEVDVQKKASLEHAKEKIMKERAIFTNGKPFFTYVFMIIQVAVFFWLELHGGSKNLTTLIEYGAKFNPYIYEGEWWRFFTPIFLHIGFLHLAMNTLALYFLGTLVERVFGNVRFVFIYLFAGIAGFIASFIFSTTVSAGASGAIFGCFGALLYFGLIYPKIFFRTMGPNLFVILAINLIFGFSASGIDNAGHLGGLVGGFLAAGMMHFPKTKKPFLQMLFLIMSIVLVASSLFYGFSDKVKGQDQGSNLILAQELIKGENYEQAYEVLKELENKTDKPSAQLYFLLSFTEIKKDMLVEARAHLEKVIQLEPKSSEAYFNLALIYMEQNNLEQAKVNAEKAAKLKPKQKEYSDLVQELNPNY